MLKRGVDGVVGGRVSGCWTSRVGSLFRAWMMGGVLVVSWMGRRRTVCRCFGLRGVWRDAPAGAVERRGRWRRGWS